MPAELDACVQKVMAEGHDESSAYAICNNSLYGSSNFVSYELDAKGELYLKYFLADSTFAKNTAVGDFSLNGAALASKDKEAIGIPFVVLPSRELSLFGDYHAWSPKQGATYDDHINFARNYSPGSVVAVSSESMQGAAQAVTNNGGRFAIVHITDERASKAYRDNPSLIPKAVSPGIINMEAPNKIGIKDFKWAHLAAVPQGAYGAKATLYASCLGGNTECVNKLVAAGVVQRAKMTNYCPIGASEALVNTSLINSGAISTKMSAQTSDSTVSTSQSSSPSTQAIAQAPKQTGAPVQKTGVLRLKNQNKELNPQTQEPQTQELKPQAEQPQTQEPQADLSKMEEVEKRLQEMESRQQLQERLKQIRNLIPMQLFVNKGKYDQKAHELAITEAAQSQWSDEQLSKYYGGLARIKEFEEANDPRNRNNQFNLDTMNQGFKIGGSSSYQTPSTVPELMGASGQKDMDLDTFRIQKVKGLMEMFHLGERV